MTGHPRGWRRCRISTGGEGRAALLIAGLLFLLLFPLRGTAADDFVTRRNDTLWCGSRPFYFAGANAYPLMILASRGDTLAVRQLMWEARGLGLSVLRTWAFSDGTDSLNPDVLQFRPGRYNQRALSGLDFVVDEARRQGLRLVLPLVNNWDDYGGMNQYVRWRMESAGLSPGPPVSRKPPVHGAQNRTYEVDLGSGYGHDDFYRDPVILQWYKNHIAFLAAHVNVRTGVALKNEPAIMAWELANEPRSSDVTGTLVAGWVAEVARFLKDQSPRQLTGTGEEGFDIRPLPGGSAGFDDALWVYDGTAGVSFMANTAVPQVDFAGAHLYPDGWRVSVGGGNEWIRDHIRAATSLRKPLMIGEFGIRRNQAAVYASWFSAMVLDGAAGGCIWHLSASGFDDGYGIRCGDVPDAVCGVLSDAARQFREKSIVGGGSPPARAELLQSFPNPFHSLATIMYTLRQDARVTLEVVSVPGQRVALLVEGFQSAGIRRELLDGTSMASGVYLVRLAVAPVSGGEPEMFTGTCVLIR